jgi:hypothetical protein
MDLHAGMPRRDQVVVEHVTMPRVEDLHRMVYKVAHEGRALAAGHDGVDGRPG